MSTQAPVREQQQTRGQPGITAGYAPEQQRSVVPEVSQGADDGYRARPTADWLS